MGTCSLLCPHPHLSRWWELSLMSFCMSMAAPHTQPVWGKPAKRQWKLKPPCHPRDLSWHRAPKGLRQAARQRQWQEAPAHRGATRVQPGRKEAGKHPAGAAGRAERTPRRATLADLGALPTELRAKSGSVCYNSAAGQHRKAAQGKPTVSYGQDPTACPFPKC